MLTTVERLKSMPAFTAQSDDYIRLLIKAASAEIEAYLNRSLEEKDVVEWLDGPESSFLTLARFPIQMITSIEADGTAVTDARVLNPDLGRLYRDRGWPTGSRNVVVDYRGGYILPGQEGANLPENIELACILQVQSLLRQPGVMSERVGDLSVTYEVGKMSSAVRSLLDGYRRFV